MCPDGFVGPDTHRRQSAKHQTHVLGGKRRSRRVLRLLMKRYPAAWRYFQRRQHSPRVARSDAFVAYARERMQHAAELLEYAASRERRIIRMGGHQAQQAGMIKIATWLLGPDNLASGTPMLVLYGNGGFSPSTPAGGAPPTAIRGLRKALLRLARDLRAAGHDVYVFVVSEVRTSRLCGNRFCGPFADEEEVIIAVARGGIEEEEGGDDEEWEEMDGIDEEEEEGGGDDDDGGGGDDENH